ncbi:MAG TPA: hypothetical protein VL285_14655 [Bryobacteraceae bacterium]|nr:hypothetical protein [Bryobacteraceae bacterium]
MAAVLFAQPTTVEGTVGVPYTFDFGQGLRGIPVDPEISLVISFTSGGGTLPPGLTLKTDGLLSGTPTAPGQYNFTINFTFSVSAEGQSFGFSNSFPFGILVRPGSGPQVAVDPKGLSFSVTTGSGASSLFLTVNNLGPLPRSFTAAPSTSLGGAWLSVSTSGAAPAFGQGSIVVTATPGPLPAGTYVGIVSISFSSGTERFDVPVILAITSHAQSIGISQSGLTFRAVSGGGAPPAQSFSVFNVGSGALNWTAATSTLSGGPAWLSATPTAGRSDAATAPTVQVQVRPAGLAPGDYYGQVRIAAPDIANSPQSVMAVLTVLGADVNPGPVVQPTGLIFVGQAGGANPPAQNIDITNLTTRAANFSTSLSFEQGNNWFAANPKSGAVQPNQPGRIAVQPALAGLAAGVYSGQLSIRFAEDNSTKRVAILLVVTPRPGAGALKPESAGRFADGCTPARLYPVFTQLGSSFTTTAAWPTALELRVVDDCGTPMSSGSVVATFSSGDPAVSLSSLRDGRWTGTWQPRASSTAVTITATAQTVAPPVRGTASIGGSLQPNASAPVIAAGGAVNAASLAPLAPLAAGGLIRISGSNLAQGSTTAAELPLKNDINGTQVLIAGQPLPLQSASNGQINAIVPFDIPVNTTHQMIVRRNTSYSSPEPVTVAGVQPAVFTKDDTGKGLALIAATKPDGTQFVVDADNPVSEGDTIVISCTGLGPVDPPVEAGVAAPSSPLSQTLNAVTVAIGGQPAEVISAVLAADMTGIYQVTATVPAGVTPAADAPLVVTVAEQASPAVTIPVQ